MIQSWTDDKSQIRSRALRRLKIVRYNTWKTTWLLDTGADAHVMHPHVWKLENSLYGLRSDPKRWLERLENILTQAGFVSNQLEPRLWAHAGKQTYNPIGARRVLHRLGTCGG